jgi:hypothetical protein
MGQEEPFFGSLEASDPFGSARAVGSGSREVDGLDRPRTAPPGGFRSFTAIAANGEVAPRAVNTPLI